MNRVRIIWLVLLVLLLPITVYAHPGRTDSKGGHHAGDDYHYHHGYSAHSHYDADKDGDLDCPYDFVDKTNQNRNSSKNTKSNTSNKNSGYKYSSNIKDAKIGKFLKSQENRVLFLLGSIVYLLIIRSIFKGGSPQTLSNLHLVSFLLLDCWIMLVTIGIVVNLPAGPGFQGSMLATFDLLDIFNTLIDVIILFFGVGVLTMIVSAFIGHPSKKVIDGFQTNTVIAGTISILIIYILKLFGICEFENLFT